MATSTAALTFNGGIVLFNGTAAQSILNNAAGVTYGTLSLSGAGIKNLTTGGTVTAATLTQVIGSGQLSVTENLDITGTGSLADLGAISATKKLRFTSSATSGTVTSMNNSSTGTLENASNGTLTIATVAGNTGTINQSGTSGSISFTNATASNGTISNTSTGTITFANNLTGTGTISQTTNGTINVGGSFTQTTYTLSGGTVVYNGSSAQSVIGGITYNNLTISTASGNNATASNTITLTGNLNISSGSTLDMVNFTASTFPGTNNNAGMIRWSGDNVFVAGAGTTEFYGAGTGNVAIGTNYGNLLFSGSGTKTFTVSVTANGTMSISSGETVLVNNGVILHVVGDVDNAGSLTNNGTINFTP